MSPRAQTAHARARVSRPLCAPAGPPRAPGSTQTCCWCRTCAQPSPAPRRRRRPAFGRCRRSRRQRRLMLTDVERAAHRARSARGARLDSPSSPARGRRLRKPFDCARAPLAVTLLACCNIAVSHPQVPARAYSGWIALCAAYLLRSIHRSGGGTNEPRAAELARQTRQQRVIAEPIGGHGRSRTTVR